MKTDWSKAFNLPWNQSDHYWLYVLLPADEISPALESGLLGVGMRKIKAANSYFVMQAGHSWGEAWKKILTVIEQMGVEKLVTVSIIPGEAEPGIEDIVLHRKPVETVTLLADNLWIGQALQDGRITCYLQPVMDKRGKIFGYESFARMEVPGGDTVAGGKIINAGKALNIEYMLDRYLHVQAIRTFISSDCGGFLFVNFVPGFIHRPEKYLEGLTEAAQSMGVASKHIVLDFIKSESAKDIAHLKRVCDYCRTKGYSLALDDIESMEVATRLLGEIKPDFLKLDIKLVKDIANPTTYKLISNLVELSKNMGCTVLAEGVETETVHQELLKAGVDLFQGYLFSPPTAVVLGTSVTSKQVS